MMNHFAQQTEAFGHPQPGGGELRTLETGQSPEWFEAVAVAQKNVAAVGRRAAARAAAVAKRPSRPGTPAEKVCWLQNILNFSQGETLVTDGIFGPKTRGAVERFQSRHGLAVDGIVGPVTETALIQSGLNQIARGSLVPVNGVMDARTRFEIKRFQSQHKLVVDGIVGPKTRAGMINALGGRCLLLPSGPGKIGQQFVQGKQPPGAGCDAKRLEALVARCREEAIQAGINCLGQFGLGISESASIVTPLVELAMATSTIPFVNAIAASIAVFAAAFLTTTQILEAAGCVENVLKNMLSCQEAARFATGC